MRTTIHPILASGLLLALLAPVTWAQPSDEVRPNGMTEREYQNRKKELRDEISHWEAEYARFRDDATGFEGIWQHDGVRTYIRREGEAPVVGPYGGEVTIVHEGDTLTVEGKVRLEGRNSGKWEGKGAVPSGSTLDAAFEASIADGAGQARYRLQDDGTMTVSWQSDAQSGDAPKAKGEGRLKRTYELSQAEVETKLYELNQELQFLRYPRGLPTSYTASSGKVDLHFTPTVEYDPQGVEHQVVEMIGGAEKSIDLCLFEFSLMRVARALVAAKDRGVLVRMVYDNREDDQPAVHFIKEHGIEAHSDGRSAYMHNKFVVIDGKTVWTGSTNISPGGIYVADNHCFTFSSPSLAKQYTTEFEEMFVDGEFGPRSPHNTDNGWQRVDRYTKVQAYFAPEDHAMDRLVELVKGARKSIRFIAFAYTSDSLYQAMVERMHAGVTVEGIFESRHAGWADIKIGPLHAEGANVRFDRNPDALHHKVVIIDDAIVVSGSFNFSDNADSQNDENMIVVQSRAVARTFKREFDTLMASTDPDDERIATSGMGSGPVASHDDADDAEGDTAGLSGSLEDR